MHIHFLSKQRHTKTPAESSVGVSLHANYLTEAPCKQVQNHAKACNLFVNLYGFYTSKLPIKNTMQIAEFKDIVLGYAYILTVTNDNEIKKYKIKIVDKYNNKKDTQKAFSFEIVDDELLSITGGIVQGMSGSPIIQNDKIIGCVTNVVIDNVKLGYGISIITMLEEGDKINN